MSDVIIHNDRFNDLRMARVNGEDSTGKRILRNARMAAIAHLENDRVKHLRAHKALLGLMKMLDMSDVNALSAMYLAVPMSTAMAATGSAGIWAAATEQINAAASWLLKQRPAFELVE